MNIQEYISSGIVESYVLGLATDQERTEFERMCDAHAEVKAAREAFELQLEQYSLQNAIDPPKSVRSHVLAEIQVEQDKTGTISTGYSNGNTDEAPVVAMKSSWTRYLAAASIVLLLGSIALNFYYYGQYKKSTDQYNTLVQQNTEMANNLRATEAKYQAYDSAVKMLADPMMAVVKMTGSAVQTSPDSNSLATVYWDTRTKDVFLHVNYMPNTPTDLQYQLWAIVDGVPVDAGVFDIVSGVPYIKMKNIPRAQAFAVTLETKGGNATPKGKMYVLGKV